MIEVEAKAKINSFEEIINKLKELNAKKIKTEIQEDIYFNSPINDFAKTDEALRIRKTNTNGKEELFITYKGPKIDKKSKTREEIEMKIEDETKCKKIFENLGFESVRIVKKTRDYYDLNEYSISLDDVEGLTPYMEIETILKDGTDYKKAQEGLFKIFEKLGITDGFERTSYLELLENKN
jgi:adenylate cyclase class 2